MNRPLVCTALGFAGGILAAGANLSNAQFILALATIFSLAGAGVLLRWPVRDAILAATFFALVGLLYATARDAPPRDALTRLAAEDRGARVRLEGTVARVDVLLPGDDYTSFVLHVDRLGHRNESHAVDARTLVGWSQPEGTLTPGMRVAITGKIRTALSPVNPRLRDYEDHLHLRDIHTRINVFGSGLEVLQRPGWFSPGAWVARMRQWQADALHAAVPTVVRDFALTVWLGDRAHTDRERYPAFVRAGTAHILAVSGVHVAIVYMSLSYGLRGLIRSRRRRTLVLMAAILIFALIAGARVSSLRAALMLCMYLGANLFDRDGDGPTALSIAGILFLVQEPGLIFDTGFLLSFGSVSSLLLFSDPIYTRLNFLPRGLRQSLSATLAVQVIPLPLAAHFFHVLPWVAPLANLIVIPLLTLSLWLCFFTVLFALLVPPVAAVVGHAMAPVVLGIYGVSEVVGSLRAGHLLVSSPSLPAVACYLLSAALLYMLLTQRENIRWKALAFGAAILATCAFWRPAAPEAGVYFLDVGRGDATFVYGPAGTTMLVDGGDHSEFVQYGERVVVPFLLAHGIHRVDHLVATHADRDHIGGLVHVLRELDVGALVLGPKSSGKALEQKLITVAGERNIPVRRVTAGEELAMRAARAEILHPPAEYAPGTGSNDQSIVIRLTWPGLSVLLPGDIEWDAEQRVAGLDCAAAVLKAPHHGSSTSSGEPLIAAVDPDYAVISTRPTSSRGGTGAGVLQRYAAHDVQVWRTDRHGGLRLTVEAGRLVFTGARISRGYTPGP